MNIKCLFGLHDYKFFEKGDDSHLGWRYTYVLLKCKSCNKPKFVIADSFGHPVIVERVLRKQYEFEKDKKELEKKYEKEMEE